MFALCEPVCAATVWVSWYWFCMDWERRYGVSFTHLGVASDSLHPEGIRTRRRYFGKVEAAIAQNEGMESLEFYLLPKKFCQTVFDSGCIWACLCDGRDTVRSPWRKAF